jgi:hypothetical protein
VPSNHSDLPRASQKQHNCDWRHDDPIMVLLMFVFFF